ncbi:MAG: hypothetical protein FD180_3438 [Planctomycetota bacterium]|nr:MAG: hypothetical protein FD180_3438 [Planctomycetota bacterium]
MPLSENDLIDLLNLRFIPVAYDLKTVQMNPGALRRIEKLDKCFSAPQIFVAKPSGKLLYHTLMAGAPSLIKTLRGVLSKNPELNHPSAEEEKTPAALDRLELALRAMDRKLAETIIAGIEDKSPRLRILRARLARRLGSTDEALQLLDGLEEVDASLERVAVHMGATQWTDAEAILAKLKPTPHVRYLQGLIPYLQRDDDRAVDLWSKAIAAAPDDPWSLRASWKMFAIGMVGDSHVTDSLR